MLTLYYVICTCLFRFCCFEQTQRVRKDRLVLRVLGPDSQRAFPPAVLEVEERKCRILARNARIELADVREDRNFSFEKYLLKKTIIIFPMLLISSGFLMFGYWKKKA